MARQSKEITNGSAAVSKTQEEPRSLAIAERGISTSRDFAGLMSAVMSDLIVGRISPAVGNATCNAGGKLLKMVEMKYKYGKPNSGSTGQPAELLLTEAAN